MQVYTSLEADEGCLGPGPWLVLFDKILDYIEVPHSIQVGAQPQRTCQPPVHFNVKAAMPGVAQGVAGAHLDSANGASSSRRWHHSLCLLQRMLSQCTWYCTAKALLSKGIGGGAMV